MPRVKQKLTRVKKKLLRVGSGPPRNCSGRVGLAKTASGRVKSWVKSWVGVSPDPSLIQYIVASGRRRIFVYEVWEGYVYFLYTNLLLMRQILFSNY